MRRYAVLRGTNVGRDLSRIRKHFIRSYQEFGDTKAIATERANARIRAAFDYMLTFAIHPHRGTVHPELRDSVRHVTAQQFVCYFETDDHRTEVRLLSVFFAGEDHLEPDPRQVVNQVFRSLPQNDYGQSDGLIQALQPPLAPAGYNGIAFFMNTFY